MKVQSPALVVLGLGTILWTGIAQSKITIDQVLSTAFPEELVASPTGNRLAWLSNDQGRRNVWEAEAPLFKARKLTFFAADDGQELTQLTWSPDGKFLVFVRGGASNGAGEIPNPTHDPAGAEQTIWAVYLSTGLPRRLGHGASPAISPEGRVAFVSEGQIWTVPLSGSAPAQQFFKARGRNKSPSWSPDGQTLAFVSEREDHSFIGLYQRARKAIRYIAPSVDRDHSLRWSPDGRRVAFVRQPGRSSDPPPRGTELPDPWAIWVADAETLKAGEIWASASGPEGSLPRMAQEHVLQWGADGSLIFASEHDGWLHLYSIPGAGGKPILLTPGGCEVEHISYSADRSTIVYSSNCGDINRRHLWQVSVTGGAPRQLTRGETIAWNPAPLADGSIAFLRSSERIPASLYLVSPSGKEVRGLTPGNIPKTFPADSLVAPQPVIFKSADGLEIHGQLFMPDAKPAGRLPAVIFIHGGPIRQMLLGWHYLYYYHNAYGMNQYLAGRGYAVLSVNFRSGTGYGRAFREAPGRGARGATEYQDIVAAGNYLRARPEIDPGRIGLWGGSYGGYLTALGLARNSDIFAAGVDLHGVHDWSNPRFRAWSGDDSAETMKKAREASPVAWIPRWRSPVLLIHGDDDRNVEFSQTVDLVQRLRAQGVPFEQIVYPDEVHDFLLYRHWLDIFRSGAEFFDRHLKRTAP